MGSDLKGELEGIKQRSITARLKRSLLFVFILTILVAAARVGQMYQEDKGTRAPKQYLAVLADDAQRMLRLSRKATITLGAKTCEAVVGSVPEADLRRCLDLTASSDHGEHGRKAQLRSCISQLVSTGS